MTRFSLFFTAASLLGSYLCIQHVQAAEVDGLFQQALTELPDNQEIAVVKITYDPGESSPPHQHNAHTFVYMLEGTVGMQVKGGELQILRSGDTFYESPDDIHTVSKNMSNSEPATFLVTFIKTIGAQATNWVDD